MKITDIFERKTVAEPGSSEKEYCTSFKLRRTGGQIATGVGKTQQAADEACLEQIRTCFRGTYTPLWLSFRGETLVVWRNGNNWIYGHIRDRSEPSSTVEGNWTSRDEAERDARRHLALATWDEQEETSEIIVYSPDEQAWFGDWARRQKVFLAKYRRLLEGGWTQEEVPNILSGYPANPARVQELGDPLQLLREMEANSVSTASTERRSLHIRPAHTYPCTYQNSVSAIEFVCTCHKGEICGNATRTGLTVYEERPVYALHSFLHPEYNDIGVVLSPAGLGLLPVYTIIEQERLPSSTPFLARILEDGKEPYDFDPHPSAPWMYTQGDLVRALNKQVSGIRYVSADTFQVCRALAGWPEEGSSPSDTSKENEVCHYNE